MRAALQRQHSTLRKREQQIREDQALTVPQLPETAQRDGGAFREGGRPGPPGVARLSRRTRHPLRQTDEVLLGVDVGDVEIRLLPLLYRPYKLRHREEIPRPTALHRNAPPALGGHALDSVVELHVKELGPQLYGGEDAEVCFAKDDEGSERHHRVRREVVGLDVEEF